jgi:hypothetical protein
MLTEIKGYINTIPISQVSRDNLYKFVMDATPADLIYLTDLIKTTQLRFSLEEK